MWQRFTIEDLRVICHYLGLLIMGMAALELVPIAAGVIMGEWTPVSHYLLCAGVTLIVGNCLRMVIPIPGKLTQKRAVAVTCLAWLVLAVGGAFPLYMSGHFATPLDALFEGMSGWTTTGASLVQDLNHFSTADNMWRFTMQGVGGLGVVVIALSLGMFGRNVDASLYSSEGRSEHVLPNIMQTTKFIVKLAVLFVGLGAVVLVGYCMYIGIDGWRGFFNGLWLSIASFNTGGMTSMSTGIVYYHSAALEFVVMLLILLGSINFTLYSELWKGRLIEFVKDAEVRGLVVWLALILAVFALLLATSGSYNDVLTLIRRGVFTIVAAFSSTGFQNISTNQLTTIVPSGALILLVFIMIVGGSSGSTTGGIKVIRVVTLGKELIAYVKDLLAPASARQAVSYYHLGSHPLTQELIRANIAVLMLYGFLAIITAVATLACGYDAASALFESVSMVSNIGMSSGIISPGMPAGLEILYIIVMWAGRLEYVTLLALLVSLIASINPVARKRRGSSRGR
ncbi:MAG: potassium transporter TrkG [Eggerthellales bacterium]|nr:potassium transporter TrkG [Eggerthellales bacterium]